MYNLPFEPNPYVYKKRKEVTRHKLNKQISTGIEMVQNKCSGITLKTSLVYISDYAKIC